MFISIIERQKLLEFQKKRINSSRGPLETNLCLSAVRPVQLCGHLMNRATNNQKPVISTNYSIKHKRFEGVIKTSSYYIQYQNKKEVTFLKELCKNGNSKSQHPTPENRNFGAWEFHDSVILAVLP